MVELEDMKSKGPVEATFWPGIKVGNIHIRLRGVGHCMHGRYKSSLGCGRGMNLLCSVTCMSAYTLITISYICSGGVDHCKHGIQYLEWEYVRL
jgi:hypothetical protein